MPGPISFIGNECPGLYADKYNTYSVLYDNNMLVVRCVYSVLVCNIYTHIYMTYIHQENLSSVSQAPEIWWRI